MTFTKEQLKAIDELAMRFFDRSDDLIFVSGFIRGVIERRMELRTMRGQSPRAAKGIVREEARHV